MVTEIQPFLERPARADRTMPAETEVHDDAADRLVARISGDPTVAGAPALHADRLDSLAGQLQPLVAWALDIGGMTDDEAVRGGAILASTRILLGVPRRIVLAAVHELPSILVGRTPSSIRLERVCIEIGLRLRGMPQDRDDPRVA